MGYLMLKQKNSSGTARLIAGEGDKEVLTFQKGRSCESKKVRWREEDCIVTESRSLLREKTG